MEALRARVWTDRNIRYLWVLPAVSSTAWFCTLFPLLVTWIADGRPVYPEQSNPYVAFISDIGAHRLKPLFVIGSVITGITYFLTFVAIRHARHDPRMYGLHDPAYKRIISLVAVVGALLAAIGLISLSIFDTFRFHEQHRGLLASCFIGLAVSAVAGVALYIDWPFLSRGKVDRDNVGRFVKWRPFCAVSVGIVSVEVVLSIAFFALQFAEHLRSAGILEWIITFVGVFYIGSLFGYVAMPMEESRDGERAPLLAPINEDG